MPLAAAVHSTAVVGPGCAIHPSAHIGPHVTIGAHVSIGSGTRIGACVFVGDGTQIGTECDIHANAVIGEPGFGFERDDTGRPIRFPHLGRVRIGNRVEKGIHLLQVWTIRPMGGEEVLVLYPQDGYWRLRPLAPAGLAPTAFGSSFLIGPVEVEGRPIVKIREVAFDPAARTFTLAFERGGAATVKMSATDQNRNALDVSFDRPVDGRPFAALRSMYVTDFNNDVARIAVREKDAKGWREDPIMAFKRALATDVWAGRVSPSRHNTSSPDMVFKAFVSTQ